MAVPIPPGYAHTSLRFALDDYPRQAVTTWAFKLNGTILDPDELAEKQYEAWTNGWAAHYDNNVTFTGCRVLVGQDAADPLVGWYEGSQKGQAGNRQTVSPAIALLIEKRTGLGGRRNRGRMYLPWAVPENVLSEAGTISSQGMAPLRQSAQAFFENFSDTPIEENGIEHMALLHGAFLGPPTEVTSLSVSPVVSTQRRRQTR